MDSRTQISLDELVQRVNDLPMLPDVALRVARASADDGLGTGDVAKLIATDQAFTSRVLKLANSAAYGRSGTIGRLTDAVNLLGLNTIRGLALAASTYDLLRRELPGYALTEGELWRHSISCALCATEISRIKQLPGCELVYVGGLLLDIGKVILNTYTTESFEQILELALSRNVPFLEAERAILGFDHAEVGARVVEKWGLPRELADAIQYHHGPSMAPEPTTLGCIVHLADIVCLTLGLGVGGDGLLYALDPVALEWLHIQQSDVELIFRRTGDAVARTHHLLEPESSLWD